jgi:hypothetical protein
MLFNMGWIDRSIRIIIASIITILYFTKIIKGDVGMILGIIAIMLFITGILGICILYIPFKFTTKKRKN